MSTQVQNEVWQVIVQGVAYETDFLTLKQWIAEGRILPTDRVKKGNLSWIEAQRVPVLRPVLSGEEIPLPADQSSPQSYSAHESFNSSPAAGNYNSADTFNFQPVYNPGMPGPAMQGTGMQGAGLQMPILNAVCHYHPQLPPDYYCRTCGATFCRECPKYVGNVPLCQLCGELCVPYVEVKQKSMKWIDKNSGFGFNELARAFNYPLKDVTQLVIAAIIYGFFVLGGQYGLGFTAYVAKAIGFSLMFSCMQMVINKVSTGKMDGGFMPDFSESSYREIVGGPLLLGLAIMIVTVGPGLVLLVGTGYALLGGFSPSDLDYESVSSAGGALLIVGLIGLLWAVFYYPMALIVAGFTQDFRSVVNPLVGLDAIKNMGIVYPKAFIMCVIAWAFGFVLNMMITFLTTIVNIPILSAVFAGMANGAVTFFVNLVVACLLGLSLYKCADQLGICTD
jgi:hypothetical protein